MKRVEAQSRLVEFATADEAVRTKEELADKAFMGRAVFIREVSAYLRLSIQH